MKVRFFTSFLLPAVGLWLTACTQEQDTKPGKPNIIYILADDLGYGSVGAYGQEKIETPNIDSLARSGMKFTQHYAGSPICAPSRYAVMTGLHTGHAYIRGNSEVAGYDYEAMFSDPNLEGQKPMPDSTVTIAEMLQQAGYKTGVVGKWGLGGPFTEGHPNKQGFDFFYGYLCQRQAHTYYPTHLWKNGDRVLLENDPVDPHQSLPEDADPLDPDSYAVFHQQPDYSAERMQAEALRFIEENRDDPFFLYLPTPIPHASLQAPQHWVKHYHGKFGDEDPYPEGRYVPVRYPNATYAAMISYLDEQVGEIVQKLKELKVYDNTLIVFTSDNGPAWIGGYDPVYFDAAAPFKSARGWGKAFLHEGGIRVPMIASWPEVIEAGGTTDHLSAFWDVMPTFCEIAGVAPPDEIDGISFLPLLEGETSGQRQHAHLYWEFPGTGAGGQQAVRTGKWKGIRKNIHEGNLEIELYDLESDIQEQNNVADQHPELIARIEQIMRSDHKVPESEVFRMAVLEDE